MSHYQIEAMRIMAGYLGRASAVMVPPELVTGEYADNTGVEDACSDDEDACSDYSNEGRLERAYQSDEDLDQVDDEAAFDLEYLDDRRYGGSTTYRDPFMESLYGGGGYGGNSADYGCGVGGGGGGYYGGLPDFDHGNYSAYYGGGHLSGSDYGSGRDVGHLCDYDYGSGRGYNGGHSDLDYSSRRGYYGLPVFDCGSSRGYYGGGHLSDSDYGSARDDGHLCDYDYGSGRGYYGGHSDLDYSSRNFHYGRGRGYHGGISDHVYSYGGRGRRDYCHEGYYGHCCRRDRYPGGLHPPMYRPYYVPRAGMYGPQPGSQSGYTHNRYPPFSPVPEAPTTEAELLGSWV